MTLSMCQKNIFEQFWIEEVDNRKKFCWVCLDHLSGRQKQFHSIAKITKCNEP